METATWGPVGALAVILALIEVLKFAVAKKKNGTTRMELLQAEGNRRLELILSELRKARDSRIQDTAERTAFQRRMEEHMGRMECVKADGRAAGD